MGHWTTSRKMILKSSVVYFSGGVFTRISAWAEGLAAGGGFQRLYHGGLLHGSLDNFRPHLMPASPPS